MSERVPDAGFRSVLFLADQFEGSARTPGERHSGGAELTDGVAIRACPWPVTPAAFRDVGVAELAAHDLIVVGNAETASRAMLDELARLGRHVLFEHDVRICRWRGNFPSALEPVHRYLGRCICPHRSLRAVYESARGVIFLTRRQRRTYLTNPFYRAGQDAILGCSLFSEQLFQRRERAAAVAERSGTCVFASRNRIKGHAEALRYCRERGILPVEIRDLPLDQVLDLFERSERFVYLPIGLEPAGRMPVEARLLGCKVVVNGEVGVAGEAFWTERSDRAVAYLSDAPRRFWRQVAQLFHGQAAAPEPAPSSPRGPAEYPGWLCDGAEPGSGVV